MSNLTAHLIKELWRAIDPSDIRGESACANEITVQIRY